MTSAIRTQEHGRKKKGKTKNNDKTSIHSKTVPQNSIKKQCHKIVQRADMNRYKKMHGYKKQTWRNAQICTDTQRTAQTYAHIHTGNQTKKVCFDENQQKKFVCLCVYVQI